MTRTIEHQQDSIKGKWESSVAAEHCLKCHGQFNWLHPKHYQEKQDIKAEKLGSHWKLRDQNTTVVN